MKATIKENIVEIGEFTINIKTLANICAVSFDGKVDSDILKVIVDIFKEITNTNEIARLVKKELDRWDQQLQK